MSRSRHPLAALAPLATVTAVLCVATAGCGGSPTTSPSTRAASSSGAPVSEPTNGARLDVAAFRSAMRAPGTVILDVRTPQEYAQGHLPGAKLVDVSAANVSEKVSALDQSLPYAIYCQSGNRSLAAMDRLRQQGFTRTYDLVGGIQAWQDAGGEIVRN